MLILSPLGTRLKGEQNLRAEFAKIPIINAESGAERASYEAL